MKKIISCFFLLVLDYFTFLMNKFILQSQIILQIYWFMSNPEVPCVCLFSLLKEYFFVWFVIWGYELIFTSLYQKGSCRAYTQIMLLQSSFAFVSAVWEFQTEFIYDLISLFLILYSKPKFQEVTFFFFITQICQLSRCSLFSPD